jgi:hypothetical protein
MRNAKLKFGENANEKTDYSDNYFIHHSISRADFCKDLGNA